NGMRLKKSFGTAIKPISLVNWRGTIVLLITCGVLYQVAPAPMRLTQPVQSLIDQVMTRIPLVGQS
ncbi:hypothetical protein Q4595_17145, partial [Wenyingzhuangia sp. 1_MG-2023]|nr:hypothetical protein [Wenyingzhuangia sp. 1_MG-2023]